MQIFSKSRRYLNSKGVLLFGVSLILLFSSAVTVFAGPLSEDPTKLTMFFSRDYLGSGSFGENHYDSFLGNACGIGIPIGVGTIGLKTTFDTSLGYYEFFTDVYNENFMANLSLIHMKEATIFRFGVSRPLMMDSGEQKIECVFGPGFSAVSSNDKTNFSMFLQARTKIYFMEDTFFYVNGLYDLMYNSGNAEIGVGFSY
jgi:hypothetical protein